MFYRFYAIKFGSQPTSKLAAAFFTESLEKDGDRLPILTAEILFDAEGSIILQVGCASVNDMNKFTRYGDALIEQLRHSFTCKVEKYSTISVFKYERQNAPVAL